MTDGIQRMREAVYRALDIHNFDYSLDETFVDDILLEIEKEGSFKDGTFVILPDLTREPEA